ncbi:MAG: hypothetical protein JRE64_23120 [Deltaproteobacteria bacterium]|nr:hypothetical protein [Deltaproteobacteria bacterium]
MKTQIGILRETFEEWLQVNELDYDYWIYTKSEWEAKEGKDSVLKGAELVIAFDNDLINIFHFGVIPEIEDELQDLAESFGYFFEHGNIWNLGFYPVENWQPLPPETAPYSVKLRDHRWEKKRNRVLARSENMCENCGAANASLEIHHCYYRYGRYPWQYPDAALLSLCKSCHAKRQKQEVKWRVFQPRLSVDELAKLERLLRDSLYWYDRKEFFAVLDEMCRHDVDATESLKLLHGKMAHPHERYT